MNIYKMMFYPLNTYNNNRALIGIKERENFITSCELEVELQYRELTLQSALRILQATNGAAVENTTECLFHTEVPWSHI